MRASLIALIALVASPLMVFAAPSSQIGSLAERDLPLGGGLSDNLGALKPEEILERVKNLADGDATDLVDNLSDNQLEDLLLSLSPEDLRGFLDKVGSSDKVFEAVQRLGMEH